VKFLLVLFYFNWAKTSDEFKEFVGRMKNQGDGMEGTNLVGIFIPTSAWHYVMVWNSTSYENVLQILNSYSEKYGRLKISLGKTELFHTLEELPFL
jgi:hypothetical protein